MVLVDHEYLADYNLQVDPAQVRESSLFLLFALVSSFILLSLLSSVLLLAYAFRSAGFFRSFVERHGSVYGITLLVDDDSARRQRSRKTTAS